MTKHSSNYPTHACVSSAEGSEAGAAGRQRRQDTTLGLNRDPSHLRRAPLLIDPLLSVNRSKFKGPSFLFLIFWRYVHCTSHVKSFHEGAINLPCHFCKALLGLFLVILSAGHLTPACLREYQTAGYCFANPNQSTN